MTETVFDQDAAFWWDTEGPFKMLHRMNPLRKDFVVKHIDCAGKTFLDVGCGGGLFCESLVDLGAEVYGRTHLRNSRSSSQLLETQKKRTSSFNILRGKRNSSNDLLASEKRAATMSGVVESAVRMPLDDDENEDELDDADAEPLTEEERIAKGAGGLLDGAFDERKSKVEFQAAVAKWREGDE